MKITLVIPEAYPSLNKTSNWHFWTRVREKERWFHLLRAAMGASSFPPPKRNELRRVTIDRYSTRALDKTNLYGGAKYIIEDNLRIPKVTSGVYKTGKRKGVPWTRCQIGLGIIYDDDDRNCELVCNNIQCKRGEEKTIVTIEWD